MIDFSKKVLKAVSSNRHLFSKELRKLVMWCGNNEKQKFIIQEWCVQNYGNKYNDVINDIFINPSESPSDYN